jgi:hypothetical protein
MLTNKKEKKEEAKKKTVIETVTLVVRYVYVHEGTCTHACMFVYSTSVDRRAVYLLFV